MSSSPRIPAALSLDNLGPDARAAFDVAAECGFRGVAIPTNHPQLKPEELGGTARRHLRKILSSKNLTIESLRIAAPRAALTDPSTIDRTMHNASSALALAHDLGVGCVSLFIGPLDNKPNADTNSGPSLPSGMLASAGHLAELAERSGVVLALSADDPDRLAQIIAAVNCSCVKANLETGRHINGAQDTLAIAEKLGRFLGQVTLADALRTGRQSQAVELGRGQVPIADLLGQLAAQNFRGPLVVDLRDLPHPEQAASHAAQILGALGHS